MSQIVPSPTIFLATSQDRDLLAELLANKRSPNTRCAYAKDIRDFFTTLTGNPPSPTAIVQFLMMPRFDALGLVLKYKSHLLSKGLKEATINRRLAALKALVDFARKVGKCDWSLSDVKNERVKPYRDTTGVTSGTYKKLLAVVDRDTLKGKRDYAILRLLWDNALRRSELSQANLEDLDLDAGKLWILGKGLGTSKQAVSLNAKTISALQAWLCERREFDISMPLFITLDNATYGHRLSGAAIYEIVRAHASQSGITKIMSPHRVRHSSITAALESSGGDVRRVQKLSRHANLDTLMIYDDNRRNLQGEITDLLADLV